MPELHEYVDYSNASDRLTGGIRRIPISTSGLIRGSPWLDSIMRTFKHLSKAPSVQLQGYSEFTG